VLFGGVLLMLGAAGAGTLIGWQNRRVVVRVHVGPVVWTGHLWAVLIVGALLLCWFLLGAAFIQCRLAERRRVHTERKTEAEQPVRPAPAPAPARPPRVGSAALQR
jgi:hypothetical protein